MQTFPHYCFFAKATALAHEYMRKTWRMRTCANHVSNWTLEHCFMTVWMSGNVGLDSGLGLLSQANYPIAQSPAGQNFDSVSIKKRVLAFYWTPWPIKRVGFGGAMEDSSSPSSPKQVHRQVHLSSLADPL